MTDPATDPQDQDQQTTSAPLEAETTDQPATAEDQATEPLNANREAAKYRRQLRDTQAALEAATERLTKMERTQAGKYLAVAADLFTIGGVQLDDLRDEGGDLSPEKVEQAAQELLTTRPGLGVVRHVRFDGGPRQTTVEPPQAPSYSDVLRGQSA